IIDLAEEKIYELDMKKKSYKVTTFAELRRRMEEARAKAQQDMQKEQAREKEKAAQPAPSENNLEFDFDLKNTGQKKTVNGFDAPKGGRRTRARKKGRPLEKNGAMVLTADEWIAPRIAARKEVAEFDIRYAKKLYGPMLAGVSAQDMAAAAAMYPMMAPAIAK